MHAGPQLIQGEEGVALVVLDQGGLLVECIVCRHSAHHQISLKLPLNLPQGLFSATELTW